MSGERIATLDGWRGIAILLVLTEHVALYTRYTNKPWANLGSFGVDIFFVLSGYLITSRLLADSNARGAFNLRSFYIRRAFRILPLVVAYLAALLVASDLFHLRDVRASDIAGSLFFFRNYQFAADPRGLYTAQFWSLCVEEHFYLLWPALLLWLGRRRGLLLAITVAIASAVWRHKMLTHSSLRTDPWFSSAQAGLSYLRTDARIDGLLIGSSLALLLAIPSIRNFLFRNLPKETPLLVAFFLYLNVLWTRGTPALSTYLLLAFMLASTLVLEQGLAHKWLGARPLAQIGAISYSIYIWQQIILLRPQHPIPLGIIAKFPFNLICVFFVAACSHYLLEKPMIAAGRRLEKKMASRHPDLRKSEALMMVDS